MNTKTILEILVKMHQKIEEEKDFLTELDNAIADGDHGINMAKGFAVVESKLSQLQEQSIGAVLKTVGMTLVSAVGGSAGPLYGTAFMKAGMVMADKSIMDMNDFLACMKAAVDGVMMRGRSVQGEKTMLDAMIPALNAMEKANSEDLPAKAVVEAGVKAARNGVEYTKTIPATKGRASYIGERSIGHQDPGATSFTYLLDVVAKAL
ncbi:MAG: dihydroxyacetone kinase subunit L [Clostridia bacterium]|nr:dihydroxyacetone kinase subunit L [Clostridia bacterium]